MKRAHPTDRRAGPGPSSPTEAGDAPLPAFLSRPAFSQAPGRREVSRRDLERLDVLGELLSTLNDPRAGAGSVARHVRQLDALAARIEERFVQLRRGARPPGLSEQIAVIGNRELEAILFAFLEDVVALHSDLVDGEAEQEAK